MNCSISQAKTTFSPAANSIKFVEKLKIKYVNSFSSFDTYLRTQPEKVSEFVFDHIFF